MKIIYVITMLMVSPYVQANPSLKFIVSDTTKSDDVVFLEEFNISVLNSEIGIENFKSVHCIRRKIIKDEGHLFSVQLNEKGVKELRKMIDKNKLKSVLLVFDNIYFKLELPDKIDNSINTLTFITNLRKRKLIKLENFANNLIQAQKIKK